MSEVDPKRPSTGFSPTAILGDVHFWIPVVVLAGGLALLSMLK
ncbi:translocated intimin receptor Tir [Paludisphaera soli]|nr:translocated intimin receptor Tir [Paludisphaera soli]